jgi:hypothetical protein
MAAKSKKKEDVIAWVSGVVDSCKTDEQFESAARLINLLERKLRMTEGMVLIDALLIEHMRQYIREKLKHLY